MTEALATDIAAKCMAAIRGHVLLVGSSDRDPRRRRGTDQISLVDLREALGRCGALNPFWFSRDEIVAVLPSSSLAPGG